MDITLSGKQILITGGTSALGRMFVKQALKEGASVFFTYHRNDALAVELKKLGAKGFSADLSKRDEIERLGEKIKAETKSLDGLIHNAAIVRDRTIQNMSEAEWDEVIAVNLTAVYDLTKRMLPLLLKSPCAKIVTLISRIGLHGSFGQVNYAASKGGLIAMTKTLAKELGRKNILVNGVNPGFMKSAMTSKLPEEIFEKNIKMSAISKISDPERTSEFLIYLLSDRFPLATGQIFHLDSREV